MIRSELLEYISYNPDTGKAVWRKCPSNRVKVGDEVGGISLDGYLYFGFKTKKLKLHRAIFLMHHGYLPKYVDHINHNRLDNRIANLRGSTMTQNNRNCSKQKNNTSGVVGVSWSKSRNKWVAMIWHNSKPIPLGRYTDKEEAIRVRKEAEIKYGYHPNHGD